MKITRPKKLEGLSILRVAAMLLVFYCHLPTIPVFRVCYRFLLDPIRAGAVGVSLFFVMSGFAMVYNHDSERIQCKAYARSLWSRISKFLPTAFVVFVLSIPLGFGGGLRDRMHPIAILANAFILQAWFGEGWNMSGVNWFLSVLIWCYALFPILNGIMLRRWGVFALLFLSIALWIVSLVGIADKMFPPVRIYEFIVGMAAGRMFIRRLSGFRRTRFFSAFGLSWILLALFLQRIVGGFCGSLSPYAIWTPGSVSLVFAMSMKEIDLGASAAGRLVRYLAANSFSFFMFHLVALRCAHAAMHVLGVEFSIAGGLLTGVAVFSVNLIWAHFWTNSINPILVRRLRFCNPLPLPWFRRNDA